MDMAGNGFWRAARRKVIKAQDRFFRPEGVSAVGTHG